MKTEEVRFEELTAFAKGIGPTEDVRRDSRVGNGAIEKPLVLSLN